jgi:dipeptidyl aminopeptidase/acylaminoacyl peptidase
MPRKLARTPSALLLAAALAGPALLPALPAAAQAGEGVTQPAAPIPVPDAIRAVHVPPIPEDEVADLLPYENLRGAFLQDWHPRERRLVISTRFGEVSQIHEVAMPLGARRQLTFYGERVFGGEYRPGRPSQVAFRMDVGGAENYQLFLMDRDGGAVTRLSDGVHRYEAASFSDDGERIAYVSNARNQRDFDLYVMDPDDPSSERRVVELSGAWYPTDWRPDGKRIALIHYVSANLSSLHVADLATGALEQVTPESEEPVSWGGGRFSADGKSLYTTTDQGSELQRLVRLDLATGAVTPLTADLAWDVEGFDLSDDGSIVFFFVNEDGLSRAHARRTADGAALPAPELPPGVAFGPDFRDGSHEVAFTVSWARSSADVYSWDVDGGKLTRWTESEMGGLDPESFPVPELVRYPTFDEVAPGERRTIPAFVYRPDPARHAPPWPVYVDIHGGPEGQERPGFKGTDSYLVTDLGVATIYPNVRGSAGYGKSYLLLDNEMRREDSVKDIGALLDWIAAQPDLDEERVMVGGGSYGGYMSLATMTFYSDRLCCAFDYVGISNFVTFLENTQGYRRDLRRVEYGDERDPEMRAFLERVSPLTRVDDITRPMLVVQGANDPRVPLSESDQVVAALQEAGTPVWYIVAEDEGHGFAKKSNSDYLRAVFMRFVKDHLLAPKAGEDGAAGAEELKPAAE